MTEKRKHKGNNSATGLDKRAREKWDRGQPVASLRLFERALEVDPSANEVRQNYAMALSAAGKADAAIDQFILVAERSDLVELRVDCLEDAVDLLLGGDRWQSALEPIRELLELRPGDTTLRILLANALDEVGLEGYALEAEKLYLEVLDDDPLEYEAALNLGVLLARHSRVPEAVTMFSRIPCGSEFFEQAEMALEDLPRQPPQL